MLVLPSEWKNNESNWQQQKHHCVWLDLALARRKCEEAFFAGLEQLLDVGAGT